MIIKNQRTYIYYLPIDYYLCKYIYNQTIKCITQNIGNS
jgi:hypothetical protein